MTAMKEREVAMQTEVDALKSEVHSLHERLLASAQEAQKLRTTVEENSIKLQDQRREIELQRRELKEVEGKRSTEKLPVHAFPPQPPPVAGPLAPPRPRLPPELTATTAPVSVQPQFRTCPNCTRQVGPDDRFCDGCGFQISALPRPETGTGK
jgi:hypothetical protein